MRNLSRSQRLSVLKASLLGSSLVLAATAVAVDETRLWLPRPKQQLKPDLVQAALMAEKSSGCREVISGELDTARSGSAGPVFLIVCRNAAGFTYNVVVTNVGRPNAKVETVQHSTTVGMGKRGAVDEKTARANCVSSMKTRTTAMSDVQIDESSLKRLDSEPGQMQFEMDFNAADPSGMALRLQASCRVSASGIALVEIRPRLDKKPAAAKTQDTRPQQSGANVQGGTTNAAAATQEKPAATAAPADKPAPSSNDTDGKKAADDGWEVVE